MQRKIHNQTLFVAALSVYLGLLIVGAPPHVLAQQIEAQTKQEVAPRLNRLPLEDFARELKEQIAASQINLEATCSVAMQATLAHDGKLSNYRIVNRNGDTALCGAAIKFIAAVNDSGAFVYLSQISQSSTTNVTFAFDAKDGNFNFENVITLENAELAKKMKSNFNFLAALRSQQTQTNAKEQEILRNTVIATKEKDLVINTRLPRAALDAFLKTHGKAN